MSHNQGEDIDEMADYYDMNEMEDDMDEDFHGRLMEYSDSDEEENSQLYDRGTDTSASEARKGKDIQGIAWDRLSITRDKYRQTRLEQYKNYENVPNSGEVSAKVCKPTRKGGNYYEFWRNTRSVKSTILHFQTTVLEHHCVQLPSRCPFDCQFSGEVRGLYDYVKKQQRLVVPEK